MTDAQFDMPILTAETRKVGAKKEIFSWFPTKADRDQARENHSQTLERLRERGGVSWCELLAIVSNRPWQNFGRGQEGAKIAVQSVMKRREASAVGE